MPTVKEMQDQWSYLGFEERCINNKDALIISFNSKFVVIPFTNSELNLTIIEFKDRILNPILSAIKIKIDQEEQNA